jgi:serine/threonine-protein kinase
MSNPADRLASALSDRYSIERELGSGGMATVYLAEDLKHDRKVALKVLRPELAAVLGADRFVQEIKTTANLQHPHILPLFDSGRAVVPPLRGVERGTGGEAFLYYVMPYIEGETLRDKLDRETQLGIDEAVKITTEVADALDYAHRNNVIHRDIKPENILLHDGRPMVADFGIALAVSAAAGGRMTETGLSLGTPHYMIYSLGAVLYEMLTGNPPHVGSSAQQIIMRIVTDEVRPVTEVRKSVPPNVAAALAKALEKLPADRFDGARAFSDALANPSFAFGPHATATADPKGSGRTRLAVPVLSVGFALAVVAAVWGWAARPAPVAPPRAQFTVVPDSSYVITATCCGPVHAVSRDGRRMVYQGTARGITQLYLREMDVLAARALPGTRAASSVFFSPDGNWIGFAKLPGQIMKANLDGGVPVLVADAGFPVSGATWTDDDVIVYSTVSTRGVVRPTDSLGLMIVDADGGVPERLTTPDSTSGERSHQTPFAIPGTNIVAFSRWEQSFSIAEAHVALLDRSTGEIRDVVRGTQPEVTSSGHLFMLSPNGEVLAQSLDWRAGRLSGPVHYLADSVFVAAVGGWGDYAVSWNGTLLYRVGNFEPALEWVRPEGGSRRVTIGLENAIHLDAPRISPDGTRLAFAASISRVGELSLHRLHVLDIARGTSLPINLDGDAEQSAWTSDGDSLVFVRDESRVVVRAADRSGNERVIIAPSTDSTGVLRAGDQIGRVTTAGPWVAFARTRASGTDIVLTRRDSTGARIYGDDTHNEYAPTLAPNGRWLAYVTNETGRDEVYIGAFPVPGGRQPVSLDGGTEPVWAHDGRTLYYRDGRGDLVAVTVEPGAQVNILERRSFEMPPSYELSGDGADYEVSPEREEFVMLPSRSDAATLVVVLNALAGN